MGIEVLYRFMLGLLSSFVLQHSFSILNQSNYEIIYISFDNERYIIITDYGTIRVVIVFTFSYLLSSLIVQFLC